MAEVDGPYSQRLNAWKDYPGFAVGLGRWLLGGEPPSGVRASIERAGGQAIVRVDLDPARKRGGADEVRAATATIVPPDTGPPRASGPSDTSRRDSLRSDSSRAGAPQRLTLAWVSDDTLEARFPIQKAGLYLGAVQLGTGTVLPLAPLSLPYSPEFEPRPDPDEGRKTLADIARITGGIERTAWDDVFDASRLRNRQVRDLVIPLALVLLVLHTTEIAGRRLWLFAAAREWLRTVRFPWPRLSRRRPKSEGGPSPATGASPVQAQARASDEPEAPPPAAPSKPATSPLARAKAKARNRMGD